MYNSLEGIRKVIINHGYSRRFLSWQLALLLVAPSILQQLYPTSQGKRSMESHRLRTHFLLLNQFYLSIFFVHAACGILVSCCCPVAQLCVTLCNSIDCRMPGLPVPHNLLKFAQVHVHCIGDAIQPSHPLMPSFLSALNLSQHQGPSQ